MAAPQRWSAISVSLLGHIAAIAVLGWVDSASPHAAVPHYRVLAVPRVTTSAKIIWYDFRKSVPEVTPDQPFGPAKTPQAEKDPTGRILITLSPDPSSTKQLIRLPDHPESLPADVPAPNLITARLKPVPPVLEAPPVLDPSIIRNTSDPGALASIRKLPPKLFVPPSAHPAGAPGMPKDIPLPPSVTVAGSPFSDLQAVMVGLNPAAAPPPPGSRSGQIARAPDAGVPSSGASLRAAATVVPGLLSHGKTGELAEPLSLIPDRRRRQEIILPGVNRTMSAPLRPSSRVIPAGVEAIFARRDVYTLVIPGPAIPGYNGDWVMWFAERQTGTEAGARISAPVPARKYQGPDGLEESATVQLAAIIDRAGRIASTRVLRGAIDPALRRRVVDELSTWEFKPALRNGDPMDVDVVLEIPFQFTAPIALKMY